MKQLIKKLIIINILFIMSLMIANITTNVYAKSNDTTLKSLSIDGMTNELEKDSSNDKIYRGKVDYNITSAKINVVPNNSNAKITVTGDDTLSVGTNKIVVKVTAEDGTSTDYIIYLRRASKPISEINVIPNVQDEGENYESDNNVEEVIGTQTEKINESSEEVKIEDENNVEENINTENLSIEEKENNIKEKILIAVAVIIIILGAIIIIKNRKK
ncbi:MAG: cadherin-like beta sandwich domain-containing protein [Clostridia bacterium]|nr:cadherin-like beta sandwich domain-containing protein [Clostridia bacterium]